MMGQRFASREICSVALAKVAISLSSHVRFLTARARIAGPVS